MDTLFQDLRYAARQLLTQRTFTVVAVITLALGIGANTAIFSVVYGVLLRPLPYPAAQELVGLGQRFQGNGGEMGVTFKEYQFLAERAPVFSAFAASTSVGMNLTSGSTAAHLNGLRVSKDYFRVLGGSPQIGRTFLAEEDQPAGPAALILSQGLWQRQFGGDPSVIGRVVLIDGKPTTVVGVMPAGFQSLPAVDAWSTLAQVAATVGSGENLEVIGRLQRGMTLTMADSRLQVPFADFHVEFAHDGVAAESKIELIPYASAVVQDVATPVKLLFGAIAFVLLIACANVASLVLSRAAARSRELAVRVALGASRGRMIRQTLTESLLLALLGGALAVVVATWGLRGLLAFVPDDLPRAADVHLDRWAMLFTFGVALFTGVIFGLIPAWHTSRADPQVMLRNSSGRTTATTGQSRVRDALVVSEVALSLVLLVGAGLMIRTFANLMRTDPGFDPQHQLSAEIWLTGSRYDSPTAIGGFYRELTARLQAIPGVASASVVEAGMPLERGGNLAVSVDGKPAHNSSDYRTITPDYFRTLGIATHAGRTFTAADDAGAAPVVIINDAFVKRYFPDGPPIGRSIKLGGSSDVPRTVVGVVGDVKSFIGYPAQPTSFVPSAQTPYDFTRVFNGWFPIHVLVRATGDPAALAPAVTRAIHETDSQVPIGRVRSMAGVLAASLAMQRFVMVLLAAFGGLAVMLAMVGIYGLISWFVVRTTRDIGVRIALGALPRHVMLLVVRRGMALTLVGATVGLVGAVALTRLLTSLLFKVATVDPLTMVGTTVLLALCAAVACYLPARRASRVDPIVSLRAE